MKPFQEDALILIVDDDPQICSFLQKVISAWGMKVQSTTNPLEIRDLVQDYFFNLVLLDIVMPEKSGLDLIPEICELSPNSKIIIMTAYADKEIAIQALRHCVFDLLEKPFNTSLLSHSLQRALEAQKTEFQYRKTFDDLKRSRDELMSHRSKLEDVNKQLMETNAALSVLAQNIERTRRETEKKIILRVRSLIIPIIEKLKTDQYLKDYYDQLCIVTNHLEDLTSLLSTDSEIASTLTTTQLRIASLIKHGLNTQEIADHLCISPSTVKTHRRNIRKKLNVSDSQLSLMDYLRTQLGEEEEPEGS